jgi:cation transport ATPase
VGFAKGRATEILDVEEISGIRIVAGLGIVGQLGPSRSLIMLGSRRFLAQRGLWMSCGIIEAVTDAESQGLPYSLVGWDGRARGLFVFEEQWRPGAQAVIRTLAAEGLDVAVLTGDHAARGRAIARHFDVSVETELLPADKSAAIDRAQRTIGPICMIGDGINDAPALATSDVGIALGCGTDVSRDSASVCLMADDLSGIPWAIELARRTRRVIRGNLAWAFGYNSVGVALAVMGWLNPALAAALMVASGSLVIVNSLRLGRPFEVALDADDEPTPRREPANHYILEAAAR